VILPTIYLQNHLPPKSQTLKLTPLVVTDFTVNPAVGETIDVSSLLHRLRNVVFPALSNPSKRTRSSRGGPTQSRRNNEYNP
jgi:hypothetical protein